MAAIYHDEKYSIYQLYSEKANDYYVCIPNNDELEYHVFVSFDAKSDVDKIKHIYDKIDDKQVIFVNIDLPDSILKEAANDNDNKLYQEIFEIVSASLHEAYQFIIKNKLAAINQIITAIRQNIDDAKFIDWLEIEMGNYLTSIELVDITDLSYENDDDEETISIVHSDNEEVNTTKGNEVIINDKKTKKKIPNKRKSQGNVGIITLALLIYIVVGVLLILFVTKLK